MHLYVTLNIKVITKVIAGFKYLNICQVDGFMLKASGQEYCHQHQTFFSLKIWVLKPRNWLLKEYESFHNLDFSRKTDFTNHYPKCLCRPFTTKVLFTAFSVCKLFTHTFIVCIYRRNHHNYSVSNDALSSSHLWIGWGWISRRGLSVILFGKGLVWRLSRQPIRRCIIDCMGYLLLTILHWLYHWSLELSASMDYNLAYRR